MGTHVYNPLPVMTQGSDSRAQAGAFHASTASAWTRRFAWIPVPAFAGMTFLRGNHGSQTSRHNSLFSRRPESTRTV